ncbi:helix-turn-helix domain-containing protein [Tsukamurella ocularis]
MAPAPLTPPVTDGIPAQLVSIRTACAMTSLSERTIRQAIYDGRLPARRLGAQKLLIAVADLDAFLGAAYPMAVPA